jgi:hypothetical protein
MSPKKFLDFMGLTFKMYNHNVLISGNPWRFTLFCNLVKHYEWEKEGVNEKLIALKAATEYDAWAQIKKQIEEYMKRSDWRDELRHKLLHDMIDDFTVPEKKPRGYMTFFDVLRGDLESERVGAFFRYNYDIPYNDHAFSSALRKKKPLLKFGEQVNQYVDQLVSSWSALHEADDGVTALSLFHKLAKEGKVFYYKLENPTVELPLVSLEEGSLKEYKFICIPICVQQPPTERDCNKVIAMLNQMTSFFHALILYCLQNCKKPSGVSSPEENLVSLSKQERPLLGPPSPRPLVVTKNRSKGGKREAENQELFLLLKREEQEAREQDIEDSTKIT